MIERRAYRRRRSYLGGRIIFPGAFSTVDCLIRDVSPTGARLVVDNALGLPDLFDLHIPSRREYLAAVKVWRDPGDVGIRFTRDRFALSGSYSYGGGGDNTPPAKVLRK